MSDTKVLNTTQVVNSIAILISFFFGYKYALKKNKKIKNDAVALAGASTSGDTSVKAKFKKYLKHFNNSKLITAV